MPIEFAGIENVEYTSVEVAYLEWVGKTIEELEKQNAALLDALNWLDTAIMPEDRKYDEWDYCRIHKDILLEFDSKIKQAIAQAEGFTPPKGDEE